MSVCLFHDFIPREFPKVFTSSKPGDWQLLRAPSQLRNPISIDKYAPKDPPCFSISLLEVLLSLQLTKWLQILTFYLFPKKLAEEVVSSALYPIFPKYLSLLVLAQCLSSIMSADSAELPQRCRLLQRFLYHSRFKIFQYPQ